MDQQQMTAEANLFNNPITDESIFGFIGAIQDPSAGVYAAVIDNAALLPDDNDDSVDTDSSPARQKKYHEMRKIHVPGKAKTQFAKRERALLQEEHALWLK